VYGAIAIRGAGARETIVRNSVPGPVLTVRPVPGEGPVMASFSDLTVQNEPGGGSALLDVERGGSLTAERIAVVGRPDGDPTRWSESVGVYNFGTLVLRDSTVTGNTGGAIEDFGSLTVVNSTLSANTEKTGLPIVRTFAARFVHSTVDGPGTLIDGRVGDVALQGSIVAGPCVGAVHSWGGNVIPPSCGAGPGDATGDPLLGPLGDHGGPTDTRVPAPGSPAIDLAVACADSTGASLRTDQRGFPRPLGAACDSGAVEAGGTAAPAPPPAARDTVRPRIVSAVPSLRRGTRARLRSLSLVLRLSEPARVRLALRRSRHGRTLRSMTARVAAGRHRLAVGRRLMRGALRPRRYVITIVAVDAAGNRSAVRVVAIRLIRR
jgi:hypothetical protein